jgi:hypothetical protein
MGKSLTPESLCILTTKKTTMPENKTQPTDQNVAQFLDAIPDEQRRKDCYTLVSMMSKAAGAEPRLWGSNIVGFGQYHYVYDSGREGDMLLTGFSPRKPALTLYLVGGLEQHEAFLAKLGKHKSGGGCLYIKKLADVHLPTLKKLIELSVKEARKRDRS